MLIANLLSRLLLFGQFSVKLQGSIGSLDTQHDQAVVEVIEMNPHTFKVAPF